MQKYNNSLTVAEGVIVLILFQIVGICLLGDMLHRVFPSAPTLTTNILSSSAIAPVLTIFYLWVRTKNFPKIVLNRDNILTTVSGIVLIFIVSLFYVMIFRSNLFIKNLLVIPGIFKNINVVWFVFWAPITEEILFRGYFLNILTCHGKIQALVISSLLFVAVHLLFAGVGINLSTILEIGFLFIYSMIFGFCYLQAGIVSSILVHVFDNFYFLVVNS